MKQDQLPGVRTICYRMCRYPLAAFFSFVVVCLLTLLLTYMVGKIFPDVKLTDKIFSHLGFEHDASYNFYTGPEGGSYYAIGKAVEGKFQEDGDMINNCETGGGSENAMRLTTERNAFGLIQEDMINHDDQLKKNVRIISPIFQERLHIFYKKSLFKNSNGDIQLSSNIDPALLKCFADSVKKVNVGPVGSGTRIIASYVLALIDKQIFTSNSKLANYRQTDEGFIQESDKMADSTIKEGSDIVFYMGADPIDKVKMVLNAKRYRLISINPSFAVTINKEFQLGLRITDFKEKYWQTNNVSTIGTYALLIASKGTNDADVLRLVKKIEDSRSAIHRSLLPHSRAIDAYVMPLNELGFFNAFKGEYDDLRKIEWKEVAAFVFSIVTLFFPVFKSVNGIASTLRLWHLNRQVDEAAKKFPKPGLPTPDSVLFELKNLKEQLVDLYGDGRLTESQFKPLSERIKMYLERNHFPIPPSENGKPGVHGTLIPATS
jgi:TRAP-type uncharacterized transport system substrate-binding protein